jgi:septal ring factor EnvC (AmiA/AmiB activator)
MVKKDRSKNITYRDSSEVVSLFEELVELDDRDQTEIIRDITHEWIMEQGLDEDARKALVEEIQQDIRNLEEEARKKNRKIEELKKKKETVEELIDGIELTLEEKEKDEDEEEKDWEYTAEELEAYIGRPRKTIPDEIEKEMEARGLIGGDNE